MSKDHWTAEEYREYQRTGREPAGKAEPMKLGQDARDLMEAYLHPTPQEEIERRYAEAEKRGETMYLDIPVKPKRKYRNEPIVVNGIRFASKHEGRVYEDLTRQMAAGILKCICRQVGFDLPGKIRYFADFVVVYPDDHIEVLDAKSEITRKNRVYINKKKQMKTLYGIDIVEV